MKKRSVIFGWVGIWMFCGFSLSFAEVPQGYGALNEATTNPACPRGYNKPKDKEQPMNKYGNFKEYQSVCDGSASYADCLREKQGIGK